MSILGNTRLTGQKESQACVRFPDSDCEQACMNICAHLSPGIHCSASQTEGDSQGPRLHSG